MEEKIFIITNRDTNNIISIHKTRNDALVKLNEMYNHYKPYYENRKHCKIEFNDNEENAFLLIEEEVDWGDIDRSFFTIKEYEVNA